MQKLNKSALAAAVAAGLLSAYQSASGQVVIGNWETPLVGSGQVAPANIQPAGPTGTLNAVGGDGWVDWQNVSVFSLSTIGATNGTHSLKVQTPNGGPYGSYVQNLTISLPATGHVGDFLTSGVLAMDVTWANADWATAAPGAWGSALNQMFVNASNNGVAPINGFYTAGDQYGNATTDSGRPATDQYHGFRDPSWFTPTAQNPNPGPTITATLTWDMSQFVDGNPANGEITAASGASNAGYINFIFATNFDGADEDASTLAWYVDNVRLLPRVVTSGWLGTAPDPDGNAANGNAAANNWFASLNWTNGVPGVQDSVANLSTGAGTGPQTVNTASAVTLGGLVFDNTGGWTVGGTGTFIMSASSNTATISVLSGSHALSNPMQLASDTTITVAPGSTLSLSGLQSTSHAITKAGTGVLSVNTVRASSLNISEGTVGVIASGAAAAASQVGNLIVGINTALDLNNNDLDVASSSQSAIQNLVKTAYHNGAWDQPGITSSAARTSSSHKTGLAVVHAADYMTITGSSTFDGLSILSSDTLVKYTLTGDTNLDGTVNTSDFTRLAASFGSTSAGWIQGDFNYDGTVNALDFNAIASNFGQTLPPASVAALDSVVPEPTALASVLVIGLAMRRRRENDKLCKPRVLEQVLARVEIDTMHSMIKRVTLSDVAKVCGVTPATVSRVLNDKAEFTASEAVRERIIQTARKLGYVPDLSARNLNRQETHIIGVFGSPYTNVAEGINESLLAGCASVLHPAGYDVFFELSSAEKRKHAVPFWRFDGALLIQQPQPETIEELNRRHVPYVCVNEKAGEPAAYILANDAMGMNMALDHLHQLGHTRIAYANAQSNYFSHYSVIERYETLLSGTKKRGMTLVEGHDQSPSSAGEFLELSVVDNGATAVISYDHHMAVKLVGASYAMNLRIPSDFNLICFNDVYPVGLLPPPLTAVSVSGREMGQIGADLLLNVLTSGKPGKGKEIRVPASLVVRGSTAARKGD